MPTAGFAVLISTADAFFQYGQHRAIPKVMPATSSGESINVQEQDSMNSEFYLMLRNQDLDDDLENAVFEAGFDDSLLTMRSGHAAIWITDRQGDFPKLVREALAQAKRGGLDVSHVEIENEVFA